MVKLILGGVQFNFFKNSNLMLKDTEKNFSLGLPPPIFSINSNISNR